MGQTALLPLRRKDSAGFEPATLGSKGQHAASRPPKPLSITVTYEIADIVDVVLKPAVAWIIVLEKSNIHGRSLQIARKLR
jgi:hypothetical protein